MTILQDILAAANWNLRVTENFRSVSPAGLFGIDPATTTGLTFGYKGGKFNGVDVVDGTVSLTASSTNYVVANRSTGVVSVATSTTNWNNTATYMRLFQFVAGGSTFTIASTSDYRQPFGDQTGLIANPMTTAEDLIKGGTAGAPVRVGVGGNGQVLTVTAGVVGWANSSSGFSNPMTTAGDIIIGGASGAGARLGVGAGGQVLSIASGAPAWAYPLINVNAVSTNYNFALSDAGGIVSHPASDTTARAFNIPANSSVAFPVGTAITVDNDFGAGAVSISITTDTLVLVGTVGSTGTRTLASGGQATLVKISSTRWRISGTGLS